MADKRAEETIYDELKHARPDWGFVMEEGGIIEGDPSKPRFIKTVWGVGYMLIADVE